MKKILIAAAVATLLAVSAVAASFEKIQTYSDGMFTDVASSAWYAGDVKNSYEFGLVNGVGANKFDPNGTVTVAQAITLAARFNSVYNGETIGSANGEWYTPYVEYAVKKGIITGNQFDSYTRAASVLKLLLCLQDRFLRIILSHSTRFTVFPILLKTTRIMMNL